MKEIGNIVWSGIHVMAIDAQGATGGIVVLWHPKEVSLTKFWTTRFSLTTNFADMWHEGY